MSTVKTEECLEAISYRCPFILKNHSELYILAKLMCSMKCSHELVAWMVLLTFLYVINPTAPTSKYKKILSENLSYAPPDDFNWALWEEFCTFVRQHTGYRLSASVLRNAFLMTLQKKNFAFEDIENMPVEQNTLELPVKNPRAIPGP